MDTISNVPSEDTEKIIYLSEGGIEKTFEWTDIYGKLDSGNYEFILDKEELGIKVSFEIDLSGNAIFREIEFLY